MDELRQSLQRAVELIAGYREGLAAARVAPVASRDQVAAAFAGRFLTIRSRSRRSSRSLSRGRSRV